MRQEEILEGKIVLVSEMDENYIFTTFLLRALILGLFLIVNLAEDLDICWCPKPMFSSAHNSKELC